MTEDVGRTVWLGGVALVMTGILVVIIRPPEARVETPDPVPSPEVATLQCLDGSTYRTVDRQIEPPSPDAAPGANHWTLSFADGGWVLDKGTRREAGAYRCEGNSLIAGGEVASYRASISPDRGRIALEGLGFECTAGCRAAGEGSVPRTTDTAR